MKITPTVLTVIVAFIVIPFGTPEDLLILALINKIGIQAYLFLLVLVGLALYHYHVSFNKAQKIFGSFWRGK
jgi:hypothetical protein